MAFICLIEAAGVVADYGKILELGEGVFLSLANLLLLSFV